MAAKDTYLNWLNDAYGMEQALVQVLSNHVKDARRHPDIENKIAQHLEQTKQHGELVKGCIERLGGHTSGLKSGLSTLTGALQGVSTGGAKDELVKNGILDFAAENFEIASYKGLITAAQVQGDSETARICQQILTQEQDMAAFLDQHLGMAIKEALPMA